MDRFGFFFAKRKYNIFFLKKYFISSQVGEKFLLYDYYDMMRLHFMVTASERDWKRYT